MALQHLPPARGPASAGLFLGRHACRAARETKREWFRTKANLRAAPVTLSQKKTDVLWRAMGPPCFRGVASRILLPLQTSIFISPTAKVRGVPTWSAHSAERLPPFPLATWSSSQVSSDIIRGVGAGVKSSRRFASLPSNAHCRPTPINFNIVRRHPVGVATRQRPPLNFENNIPKHIIRAPKHIIRSLSYQNAIASQDQTVSDFDHISRNQIFRRDRMRGINSVRL
jgi:hypothetical protein